MSIVTIGQISDALHRFARRQDKDLAQWSTTGNEGEYELLLSEDADDVFAPVESVIVTLKYNRKYEELTAIQVQ